LLRETLGNVGRGAADVAADDLDLFAGDGVAVLFHVGLYPVVELDAGVGELARENIDQPDLDRALRIGARGADEERNSAANSHAGPIHRHPPGLLASVFVKNCTYENSRGRGCSSHRIVGAAPSPAIIAGAQRGARRVNATCHHPLSSKCFFSTDGRVEPGRDKSRTAKALVSELTNCPSVDGATTCIRSPAHGQKCRNHRALAAMPDISRTSHYRRIRP